MKGTSKHASEQESRLLNGKDNTPFSNQQNDFEDNSSEAIQIRQLQQTIDTSDDMQQELAFQDAAHQHEIEQQEDTKPNTTGLPNQLKRGMEQLSGISLDDVNVHYNSTAPEKINAHAHTEGRDIYVAPGQEAHLPEELGHVVQQKTQTIQPTKEVNGETPINDDERLEQTAVSMGEQALQTPIEGKQELKTLPSTSSVIQRNKISEKTNLLHPLYQMKDGGNLFRSEANGTLKKENNELETLPLSEDKKLHHLETIKNPKHLPKGSYYWVKFIEAGIDPQTEEKIAINWEYGYVKKTDVEALAKYKHIKHTKTDPNNPKQGKIFPEDENDPPISQEDVFQSGLSDCYLQAPLISLVSTNPDAIMNLFEITKDHVTVHFHPRRNQEEVSVKMSKKLFLTPDGEPLYGGKRDNYLWPAFIQKAWAICEKKYANISMGPPDVAMQILLGRLTGITNIGSDSTDHQAWETYDRIVEALDSNRILILGTTTWVDQDPDTEEYTIPSKSDHGGLGIAHSYAICDISNRELSRHRNGQDSLSDVSLSLRDPRDREGNTFEVDFMDIIDPEKIAYIAYSR